MVLGSLVYLTGLFLTCIIKESKWEHPIILNVTWVAFAAAFCFGIGDAVVNTQVYATLGEHFRVNNLGAFTVFQFLQGQFLIFSM